MRKGDAAQMAIIELVDFSEQVIKEDKSKKEESKGSKTQKARR